MTMSQLQLLLDNAVRRTATGGTMGFDEAAVDLAGYDKQKPGPFTLVSVAQRYIKRHAANGVDCPCCGRLVKEYRRKINAGMAATLVWMVGVQARSWPSESGMCLERGAARRDLQWIDVQREAPKSVLRSRELGKLRHWGLVEQEPGKVASWAPTQRGVEFVTRRIRVQSHALIQDNVCNGFDGELISIDEALGEKFDYQELMKG